MRRVVFLIASVLVSGLFLWLALRGVNLAEIGTYFARANPVWLALSFISVGFALFLRGVRWRILVGERISFLNAFHIFNITMILNQLPLRAGEVARSLMAMRYGVPFVTAATSIVVERLIDVVMVVVLIALSLSRAASVPEGVTRAATLFGILAIVGFIVLIAFARVPHVPRALLAWLERRAPFLSRLHLRQRLDEVLDGLRPLIDWRRALQAIFWTLIGWGVSLGTFYCIERAFDVQAVLPGGDLWMLSALAVSLASLGIAIPVTVAGIGPFEYAVRESGVAFGLDPSLSTSLGFAFHGITVLAYAVFGILSLIALGVSFSDLMRGSTTPAPAEPVAPAQEQP